MPLTLARSFAGVKSNFANERPPPTRDDNNDAAVSRRQKEGRNMETVREWRKVKSNVLQLHASRCWIE